MTFPDRIVRVSDMSEVAGARRAASECAATLRLASTAAGKVALVATELATNVLKHGQGGEIIFTADPLRPRALIIIAIDKGRGIGNVPQAMADGYSTAGSPGTGLGAIARAASFIDIYGIRDKGSAILARIEEEMPAQSPRLIAPPRVVVGGIDIAKPGEEHSGDSWIAIPGRDVSTICVADGLGHGQIAATASLACIRAVADHADLELDHVIEEAHGALRPTRGAAVGIARIHGRQSRIDFLGVGNIAGTIVADESVRRTVSSPGIVGHEMRKVQTFSYPWTASAVLVLASDGVSANWNPASYPGLMQHDPALIAAVIYRDHRRGNDDATVVVAKAG